MRTRRGEVATILTVATLVVVGVTAVVSSLNLNKKQTTSSRASTTCPSSQCNAGSTCLDPGQISSGYKCCAATKNPAHPTWTYASFSPTSTGCLGDILCVQKSCSSPNEAKKYYQKDGITEVNYSDASCGTKLVKTITEYCKETGGANVTPIPLANPLQWGLNQGGGCGSGGVNYKFGSCYQGKRCVQCQHGGVWLGYNCFESDSSCADDVVYCAAPWTVKTCYNGQHKCCNATDKKCLKSGNDPAGDVENIAICEGTGTGSDAVCDTAKGEYCGQKGGACNAGDTLAAGNKICNSANNSRCCQKANTCDGKSGYKCVKKVAGKTIKQSCQSSGYDDETAYPDQFSCGDSSKICCQGTYTPPVDPAGDGCEKKTDTCPKDASVTYEYYQSKGAACAEGIPSSKCFGVKSDNCSLYTKTEVQEYSCDTGELPVVKCEGETVKTHTCEEYCKALSPVNSKTSSSPDTEYAYTGVESSVKYWTDTTCKTAFDPVAKCDCKTSGSNECVFGDGVTIKYRETLCKNNKIYICSNTGQKTGPTNCDTGLVCESGDNPQKCVSMSNLGTNSCIDTETKARSDCGKTAGDVVKTQSCTDENGWSGTSKYSIVCPSYAPWSCIYHIMSASPQSDGSITTFWNVYNDYSTASEAKAYTFCERAPNQTRTIKTSLTVENMSDFVQYGGELVSGFICISPSSDVKKIEGQTCKSIDVTALSASNKSAWADFSVKPEESFSLIVGYVVDSNGHVYQASTKIRVDDYTPPLAGGYGLKVDANSPTK